MSASALYGSLGSPLGAPASAAALASMILFPSIMASWVLADARRRRQKLPYDFGSFVFFAWPVVVPIYLFATRGWRAFGTLGLYFLIYLAAAFTGVIPLVLRMLRR
jgi:hypothetical protein